MTTVRSLAKQTGFSVATISRTLAGSTAVSPETRAIIEATIRKTGHQRRPVGRQRSRTRQAIGIYANKRMRPLVMHDPVYSLIYDHLDFLLAARGYELVRIDAYTDQRNDVETRRLRRRILDEELRGMLVYGDLAEDGLLEYLDQRLLPVLRLNRRHAVPENNSFVAIDQAAGSRMAAEHLLRLGHRRILLVIPMDNGRSEVLSDRIAGFQAALAAHGVAQDPSLIIRPVTATLEFGYQAVRQWLAQGGTGITAAFCNNDEVAVGAMRAFREVGIRVPEDIALVGFDDLPIASFCTPALTTVRQDFASLAQQVVGGFLPLCERRQQPPLRCVLVPELVIRASCGAQR